MKFPEGVEDLLKRAPLGHHADALRAGLHYHQPDSEGRCKGCSGELSLAWPCEFLWILEISLREWMGGLN